MSLIILLTNIASKLVLAGIKKLFIARKRPRPSGLTRPSLEREDTAAMERSLGVKD